MSYVVCPTITADSLDVFDVQVRRVQDFAKRIHIDFSDGSFAPTKLVSVDEATFVQNMTIDVHLMLQNPLNVVELIKEKKPNLAVVHAESQNIATFYALLQDRGIKRGIALLQDTDVDFIKDYLNVLDHVLVFSGNLGYHGGEADLGLLDKVRQIRELSTSIEIGWDGGINNQNYRQLVEAGVNVLNVGGFIQNSQDPKNAFEQINEGENHSE